MPSGRSNERSAVFVTSDKDFGEQGKANPAQVDELLKKKLSSWSVLAGS